MIYDWKFYYSVIGYLPWFALVLAFILFKDNHNRESLYILIPLLIANFFWMLFKIVTKGSPPDTIEFDVVFYSFIIGLSVLWLTSYKFSKLNGLLKFFLSLIIMTIILSAGILTVLSDFSKTTALMFFLFVFVAGATLFGFAWAGRLCKKQYSPKAFLLWSVLCLPVCSITAMIGYFIVGNSIMNSTFKPEDFLQVMAVGLIIGFLLYFVILPFLIISFVIPFYRKRFCDCLRLKTSQLIAEQEKVEAINV